MMKQELVYQGFVNGTGNEDTQIMSPFTFLGHSVFFGLCKCVNAVAYIQRNSLARS